MSQRLRFTFSRGEESQYTSHLDLARVWERAVRRARLPLAFSQGYTPHARLAFAAPLAVGTTSAAELVDLYLSEPVAPEEARERLAAQMPPGIRLETVAEIVGADPSLQSQVRAAEYEARFEGEVPGLAEAAAALLARASVPFVRRRQGKSKTLDLRPYVEALEASVEGEHSGLRLLLRVDEAGSVRPDEVLVALGLGGRPVRLHRTRLLLAG